MAFNEITRVKIPAILHLTRLGYRYVSLSNSRWEKMSKADLRKASCVSPNTMTKLRLDEPVMFNVLNKICKTLDVNYGDIVDYIADEERSDKS